MAGGLSSAGVGAKNSDRAIVFRKTGASQKQEYPKNKDNQ